MTDTAPPPAIADLAPIDRARADQAAGRVVAHLLRSLGASGYTADEVRTLVEDVAAELALPPVPAPATAPLVPYYEDDRCLIYVGDTLHVLANLDEHPPPMLAEGYDLLATDPPYSSGGQFRGDRTGSTVAKYVNSETVAYRAEFAGDNRDARSYLAWVSLWTSAAIRLARPGAIAALFTDWRQLPTTTDALQAGGWVWRGIAPWDKVNTRPMLGGYRNQAEYVVWGTAGPRDPSNRRALQGVLRCGIVRDREHIAQKPEDVMRWLVGVVDRPDGVVLDPFLGSGTTARAALDLGLRFVGVEVDEHYAEIAARRITERLALPGTFQPVGLVPPEELVDVDEPPDPSLFCQPDTDTPTPEDLP